MVERGWQWFVARDGLFELWLPPGAALIEAPPGEPGETYLFFSPSVDRGTFSVLRQSAPGQTPEDLLALEQEVGAAVTVEVDAPITRAGRLVHHLRYRSALRRSAAVAAGVERMSPAFLPGATSVQMVDVLFWRGRDEAISAGYRVDVDAPPVLVALFERMMDRFHLLKGL